LTATLSTIGGTQISPTSSTLPLPTVSPITTKQGSRGVLYGFLGGGLLLIFVIGILWLRKSRRK
jgi:hypothetical protein